MRCLEPRINHAQAARKPAGTGALDPTPAVNTVAYTIRSAGQASVLAALTAGQAAVFDVPAPTVTNYWGVRLARPPRAFAFPLRNASYSGANLTLVLTRQVRAA